MKTIEALMRERTEENCSETVSGIIAILKDNYNLNIEPTQVYPVRNPVGCVFIKYSVLAHKHAFTDELFQVGIRQTIIDPKYSGVSIFKFMEQQYPNNFNKIKTLLSSKKLTIGKGNQMKTIEALMCERTDENCQETRNSIIEIFNKQYGKDFTLENISVESNEDGDAFGYYAIRSTNADNSLLIIIIENHQTLIEGELFDVTPLRFMEEQYPKALDKLKSFLSSNEFTISKKIDEECDYYDDEDYDDDSDIVFEHGDDTYRLEDIYFILDIDPYFDSCENTLRTIAKGFDIETIKASWGNVKYVVNVNDEVTFTDTRTEEEVRNDVLNKTIEDMFKGANHKNYHKLVKNIEVLTKDIFKDIKVIKSVKPAFNFSTGILDTITVTADVELDDKHSQSDVKINFKYDRIIFDTWLLKLDVMDIYKAYYPSRYTLLS